MCTKNKTLIKIILIILLTAFNASANIDENDLGNTDVLLLKAGHVKTDIVNEYESQASEKAAINYSAMPAGNVEKYYIVQFSGHVQEKWKQDVSSKGAEIYNYIPNNAFVFKMNEDVKIQVQALDFVKWVGEYKPSYKYDPEVTDTKTIQIASPELETDIVYQIILFSAEDYERVANDIETSGGNVISGSRKTLKVQSQADILPGIATINGISWIEEYVQPTVDNGISTGIVNVETVHETFGLNGSGQIVAVCDTGLDTGVNDDSMHADLRGRIINIFDVADDGSAADQNGHGTHVSGSVLGNGALSGGEYTGIAPEASLIFQAAGNSYSSLTLPGDLNDLFQQTYDLGARIHTNSWGSPLNGDYTTRSQQVDQFMWEHPDMLILFSAGNSGVDSNADGVVDQDSLGAPATAKNCLTVGASENYRPDITSSRYGTSWPLSFAANPIYSDYLADDSKGIAAFSSRGPTDDGRIKPDVVAPGTFIASTRSSIGNSNGWGIIDDNYLYMGGTSMSTPITAGSVAIVREYYTEIESLSNPSAALLKATLINGALNITPGQYGTGSTQEISGRPDYSQGWGRVDVGNSICPQYPEVISYFDNIALNYSESWNISYDIVADSEILRATLAWTDYPGDAAVELQLVNNLDLKVVGPDDTTYYGNGAPDELNNVEGIELINPASGTYTFIVNGTNIPQGPQNFSLVLYTTFDSNEYPQNDKYTDNATTAVYLNFTHPHGINASSINMTIDGLQVVHSLEGINGGYRIENLTAQPYSEGYHDVFVSALTNLSREISYEWRFYSSVEENVIQVQGLEEKAVIQEESFEINISNRKMCDFWYSIDNGANSTKETGFSSTTILNITEGNHSITVFAEDITGHVNSTTVNFTVFTSQPTIDSPESGTIYYLPISSFSMNGSAGVATNVSVYVNGVITNLSHPVSSGIFNLSGVPLSNGTNTINVTSIFNNSEDDYYSSNTTIYLSLGETFDTTGNDEVTLHVPGIGDNVSDPSFNFNITGTSANPGNLSVSVIEMTEPDMGSKFTGSVFDIIVKNESDEDYSHQFGRNVSLTLGYDPYLVTNTEKVMFAWYDPDNNSWIPFRTSRNISAHTVTANITHLSIYAPLEDNIAPVISDLSSSSTTSSITLVWSKSEDTNHVEIWKNGKFLKNNSGTQMTDTGLSAGTSYLYSLKAIDFADNIGSWSNTSIKTSTEIVTSPGSSSSGGGGGGGGGGSTGEEYENIALKDVLTVYAGKEEVVDFDFNDVNNDIDYVRYHSLKNAGKITVTIEVLKNISTFTHSPAPDLVYKNINIWVGKTGYATEGNIEDPTIGFRVDRSWVVGNFIDEESINLYRYADESWEKLPTEQSGSDENYLYFESRTPGFSPFAITGKSTIQQMENNVNADVLLEQEVQTDEVPLPEEESGSDSKPSTSNTMSLIYTGFAGIILTIAYFIVRKQQN
ncbi:PGF-pre-PGF domain-containing protein [Methanolobus sp. ZRKC2]|uniref:PGF-pre-PGF domain-containing protein n=1 Tax=Methanolobus sp. ZRKC2 TaxID=3125783 RepID=UPI00324D565B